jgi:hypothetical protein
VTRMRVALVRVAFGAAFLGLFVGTNITAARAADDSSANTSAWSKVMQTIGIEEAPNASANINYTERAPLVVPPSRDLPPPAAEAAVPAPDWPKEPPKPTKGSKTKTGVVPETAVQTANPPWQKKPWYNPIGWFDKEEYANFAGEPVRADLTDPPAGYRVPSPAKPYGINPNQKPYVPTARDFNLGRVGDSSGK